MTQSKKILTNRQEILDYAGISKKLYLKFVRKGFPVLYVDGHCYAHTDNIDEFFRLITQSNAKNLPMETILGEENLAESAEGDYRDGGLPGDDISPH